MTNAVFRARFRADVRGATSIEYALIASIVSLAIIAGATSAGLNLVVLLSGVLTGFQ